ncbi:uncharacterized protein VTP21DRAFT_6851 [Calcarisporiella thermophila]|uniref:uncharacterized protein n=1 Tax=Calcarisporiella thermophila TaxID=911321 RepID=UPI003743D72D
MVSPSFNFDNLSKFLDNSYTQLRDTVRQQQDELEQLRTIVQRQKEEIEELRGLVARIPEIERQNREAVRVLREVIGMRIGDGEASATSIVGNGDGVGGGGSQNDVAGSAALGMQLKTSPSTAGLFSASFQQLLQQHSTPTSRDLKLGIIESETKNRTKSIQHHVRSKLIEFEKKSRLMPATGDQNEALEWNYSEPLTHPTNQRVLDEFCDLIMAQPPSPPYGATRREVMAALEKLFTNRRREKLKPDEKRLKDTVRKRRNTRLHLKSERRKEVLEQNIERIEREGLDGILRPIEEIRQLLDVRAQSPEVTDEENNEIEGENHRSPLKKRRVINRSEEAAKILRALDEMAPDTLERLRLPPPPENDGLEKTMPPGFPAWAYTA